MSNLPPKLIAFFFLCCIFFSMPAGAAEIYVSVSGSDRNDGTAGQPLATISMALRKAREMRRLKDPGIENGIRIIVHGGEFLLTEPIFIRPEDSGTESSPTTIEAAPGATPVISGGIVLRGWRKVQGQIKGLPQSAQGKIWMAPVTVDDFRQLWVNGIKAVRARETDADSMARIIDWHHQQETCTIPFIKGLDPAAADGMEMVIHQWWAIAILRIRTAKLSGKNVVLGFYQPESRVQSEHPWPAPWLSKESGNSAFYLANAIQFLDQPGEWYLDRKKQMVYYYPGNEEKIENARFIAPALETLVKIEGTRDQPVSHVYFKGIQFSHTGWLRPSQQGHVPHQAGMYMLDAYKLKKPGTADKAALENQAWVGRPAAAVEATYTSNTGFENCRFVHLASTGLDYRKGNHQDKVRGNLFKDIGGSGILIGTFSDEATEVHLPYNPSDEREISTGINISNNLITGVTNEDWGCVGIGAGYVRDISIEHNDIGEVSYSGISLGWGWTKTSNAMRNNKVRANRIHHYAKHLYDVAGIYTLSAQPGTIISENCIDSIYVAPYAHIPSHWFYLYTDEGTSHITVRDNWCPAEKFLQNANGPGNAWQNNGPMAPENIKSNAGLQQEYQYLLKERVVSGHWPINRHISTPPRTQSSRPAIVEVITASADSRHQAALAKVLTQHSLHADSLYSWKNHYVFFAPAKDAAALKKSVQDALPGAWINVYDEPFYDFNRSLCIDVQTATQWDHILLTAQLAADTALQRGYMEHHRTQFTHWPEITRGFCNASFQQLLLYRNGRQLMLVISIPRGESLDRLNPKTTENNPRVNEWNTLMKKYQTGIDGAALGEVWVLLKPVNTK